MLELIKSKVTLVLIIAVLGLAGIIAFQQNKIVRTMALYTTSVANEKAAAEGLTTFRDKYNQEHARTRTYTKTVRELEASKDQVTQKLVQTIKDSGIKLKNVKQAGLIKTVIDTTLTATIKPIQKADSSVLDTTVNLSTKDIKNIVRIKGDKITSEIGVDNEQSIILSSHKETINPPRKFFLWRWFQKKHIVAEVEVINSNPLLKTKQQTFIIVEEQK